MSRASEILENNREKYKKHHSDGPRRALILGVGVGLFAAGYLLHQRKMDPILRGLMGRFEELQLRAYDEGVRSGRDMIIETLKDRRIDITPALSA